MGIGCKSVGTSVFLWKTLLVVFINLHSFLNQRTIFMNFSADFMFKVFNFSPICVLVSHGNNDLRIIICLKNLKFLSKEFLFVMSSKNWRSMAYTVVMPRNQCHQDVTLPRY